MINFNNTNIIWSESIYELLRVLTFTWSQINTITLQMPYQLSASSHYTPSLSQKKLVAALLRVAGITAGLAESNGSLPSGLRFTSPADCRLTAKNRDQLRYPTVNNRVWATYTFLVADQWCLVCCAIVNGNSWYDSSSIKYFLLGSTFSRVGTGWISLLFFVISWNMSPFVDGPEIQYELQVLSAVLVSNSAFLIFAVLVVCFSHSRPYKMF